VHTAATGQKSSNETLRAENECYTDLRPQGFT
jgi:hypothetical protein